MKEGRELNIQLKELIKEMEINKNRGEEGMTEDWREGANWGLRKEAIVLHLMCGRAKLQPIQIAFARQQEKLQI